MKAIGHRRSYCRTGVCCAIHVDVLAAVTGLAVWSWVGPVMAVVAVPSVIPQRALGTLNGSQVS